MSSKRKLIRVPCYFGYTSITYARYIIEKLIGRKLLSNELVHHKDENPFNDDISNLEVMSKSKHNTLHHGGKDKPKSHYLIRNGLVLSEEDVKGVKRMLRDEIKGYLIALAFGATQSTISMIKTGRQWEWVTI